MIKRMIKRPSSPEKSNARDSGCRPALFFDSGIGGLTVLREARLFIPDYPFLYIVDNAAFPYGAWEEEALRRRLLQLFERLLKKYNPVLSVLACNTASTLVLDDLRHAFPRHDFVGTVPAIKPAAEYSASKKISVLATPGTVRRAYTRELIAKYAKEADVTLVGSKNLANEAENYVRGRPVDKKVIAAEIAPCFTEEKGKRTDIIVLACTHYPFLTPVLRDCAPWPVDWLDPAEAIARRAQSLLRQKKKNSLLPAAKRYHCGDFAVFTAPKAEKAVVSERLFHAFGLKIKKAGRADFL